MRDSEPVGRPAELGRGLTQPSRAGCELLIALVNREDLEIAVPEALDVVARDPLTSVYLFRGDLLRGLMEVPNEFWGRHPNLFKLYRHAVRAGAEARLQLPSEARLAFWAPLELRDIS